MIDRARIHPASVYPGWWLSVGASLSLGMIAGVTFFGFGLFVVPLEKEFGWSRSLTSAAVSLTLLASGLASPLVGRLVDRYRPRMIILIGTIMTAGSFLLLARIDSLWQFFAVLGVLAFFRAWIDYVPFTTLITRWFARGRAAAIGIATAGFGMGGFLVLPVLAELITWVGWRASLSIVALVIVVINGCFVFFFRNDPPRRWVKRYTLVDTRSGGAREGIYHADDVGAALGTPAFWLLTAGFALFFCAQWAFLFHGVPFLEGEGLSSHQAAWVLGGAAGLGVLLRVVSGLCLDRVRRVEMLAGPALLIMAGALMVLAAGVSVPSLVIFALLWGVGSGIAPLLEPVLVARLFGRARYGSVYGAVDGIDALVAISGPLAGGLLFDLTGAYQPVLLLYAGAFVVGALSFVLLVGLLHRDRQRTTSQPAPQTEAPPAHVARSSGQARMVSSSQRSALLISALSVLLLATLVRNKVQRDIYDAREEQRAA